MISCRFYDSCKSAQADCDMCQDDIEADSYCGKYTELINLKHIAQVNANRYHLHQTEILSK